MNLMTLVRLLVLLVVGWTAISLGAGLSAWSSIIRTSRRFSAEPALEDAIPAGPTDVSGLMGYRLINQTNGQ